MKLSTALQSFLGILAPESRGPDGFFVPSNHPYRTEHLILNAYLKEVSRSKGVQRPVFFSLKTPESQQAILDFENHEQIRLVHAIIERLSKKDGWDFVYVLNDLLNRILKSRLPFVSDDFVQLLNHIQTNPDKLVYRYSLNSILRHVERSIERNGMNFELRYALEAVFGVVGSSSAYERRMRKRIRKLFGSGLEVLVEPGEPWSDQMLNDLHNMESDLRSKWERLIHHLLTVKGASPSEKWLDECFGSIGTIGRETFANSLLLWFEKACEKNETRMQEESGNLLKGFVWAASLLDDEKIIQGIGALALASYQKIPNIGARARKVGNACLYTLGQFPGLKAINELSRIQQKIKYADVQRLVAKTLRQVAERQGFSLNDLEELSVPEFGLDQNGKMRLQFGEYQAEISIEGSKQVTLSWINNTREKKRKSVPKFVRQHHPDKLKSMRVTRKAIQDSLSTQRGRMERLFLLGRVWPFELWRTRYLDHPLVGQLTKRLIWHFKGGDQSGLGMWNRGEIVNAESLPLNWINSKTEVRLWHPIGFDVETVLSWRRFLEEHQISQPFKQAHREVYVLTDAEVETFTYSNRFAAHILKQHQLAALCKQRDWSYTLQGAWDSSDIPTVTLPETDLKAQFWVQPIGDDLSPTGIYLYVSTDQVRFTTRYDETIPLAEVPAPYFSELMRDVDLFVGVCSVGNDPTWMGQGDRPDFGGYWHSFSFGELSESAKTRKDVLEELLPRLKIADHCQIRGRFLVVKGQLRTYKIHLGSSNIQMEPNDQYLCVVPDRSLGKKTGNIFLPFEGDQTLSIILSKAFLLAEDTNIKDPTILRQIQQKRW